MLNPAVHTVTSRFSGVKHTLYDADSVQNTFFNFNIPRIPGRYSLTVDLGIPCMFGHHLTAARLESIATFVSSCRVYGLLWRCQNVLYDSAIGHYGVGTLP